MKIVFFDCKDYEIEYLEKNCPKNIEKIFLKNPLTKDINFEDFKDIDFICPSITSICNKENLSKFKNLSSIFTRSTGFDHIDLKYCKSQNISVYNIPHYGDWTVAEYTFALMLGVSRNIIQAELDLRQGEVNLPSYMGIELHSKTIGIIGLGQIGERVAKISQGFNMNILYSDIKEVKEYKKVSLETLLRSSDFITINCPLNNSTHHLLSYKEFDIIKQDAVIINTARGEIINTEALVQAIEKNKINYLGLDVLECEVETTNYKNKNYCADCIKENCVRNYILNQKLLWNKNIIITPHIGYNTKEAVMRILNTTLENIENFIKEDFKNIENNKVV